MSESLFQFNCNGYVRWRHASDEDNQMTEMIQEKREVCYFICVFADEEIMNFNLHLFLSRKDKHGSHTSRQSYNTYLDKGIVGKSFKEQTSFFSRTISQLSLQDTSSYDVRENMFQGNKELFIYSCPKSRLKFMEVLVRNCSSHF